MERSYVVDKTFDKIDFTQHILPWGDYENCSFKNCNFLNVDLSNYHFDECSFIGSSLGMAKLDKTAFKEISFKNCKLLGLHFESCDPFLFSITCEDCSLRLASFFKMKIPKTKFINCGLEEVDFAETDLSACLFDKCNMAGAIFDHTNLEKADLRTSFNYSINPQSNKIKKAKFSLGSVAGLLDAFDIEIED